MTRPLQIATWIAISLALTAASLAACAQTAPPEPAASTAPAAKPAAAPAQTASNPVGSAERGRMLTYTCQGCHGVTGYENAYPNYHVPMIGGQSVQYLTNALTEYRAGTRKHPTMQAQSQTFSDQDIADIATYLSELKP